MISVKINRNVELANDEIMVRLPRFTKISVTPVMTIKLTQGILFCLRLNPKAVGNALSVAIIIPRRAVPNIVALIADAVENSAARPIS